MVDPVAAHVRAHKQALVDAFESEVARELPDVAELDRTALLDHLPEFLDGLAQWIEGDTPAARVGFDALADGHAVQRLGYGIDLRSLTREYALLRTVILRELRVVADAPRDSLIRLNEGLDVAMHEAVRRYAETRDRARDLFIAILAHDLRNPLNAVIVSAGALQLAAANSPDLRKAVNLIEESGERMAHMVSDLLDLARGQLGGGIRIQLALTDLGDIVERIAAELRAAHPTRDIRLARRGDLRGVFDRPRAEQALSNLIGNAIQHGHDPIELDVHEVDDRRSLVTSVTSRGEAISPSQLASFFDPFRPDRRGSEGLGLGLYIVGQIAVAHGAHVDTRSTATGTSFVVTWPRVRPEDMTDDGRAG
ncbi:MAG: HAMP domain-containing sensor histidine kinase [Kofleriaceae bacterium]